jgi:hypothetical protein
MHGVGVMLVVSCELKLFRVDLVQQLCWRRVQFLDQSARVVGVRLQGINA